MRELAALGIADARAVPGGVAFGGTWESCYRANLGSRVASRILWRVGEFAYRNEHELYAAAKAVDWPRFFALERTLRVNVTAQKSPLKSLEFATLRIKDAVCDRFRDATGKRPSVERVVSCLRPGSGEAERGPGGRHEWRRGLRPRGACRTAVGISSYIAIAL